MRSSDKGLAAGRNPAAILTFWNRMHRYRGLFYRYWWVLALTLSLAVCLAAAYELSQPASYLSTATLTVNLVSDSPLIGQEARSRNFDLQLDDYVENQITEMKNAQVSAIAQEQLQATHPEDRSSPVALDFTAKNNMLTVAATGANPTYTQHYLQAHLDGLLKYHRTLSNKSSSASVDKIREQMRVAEAALKADNDNIIAYERKTGVVFQKDGANGNGGLVELRQKLAALKDEAEQLQLMTPEQGFHADSVRPQTTQGAGGNVNPPQDRGAIEASPAEADYRQAQADLARLKAQLDDLSQDLRPKHPKIIELKQHIEIDNQTIASLLQQNRDRIQNRLNLVQSEIQSTQDQITAEKPKALDNDLLRAGYDALVEAKERDAKTYDDLAQTLKNTNLGNKIEADPVQITGEASPAEPVPSNWMKAMAVAIAGGLATGIGILFCIDRMDDRMGSIADFQQNFVENIIGQIPRDVGVGDGDTELLRPDDDRHMLVESFRNLRSTLLYMPLDGQRPKTLLITSAVPNEGKSTVSSNLALVLAYAGMKTLLIDADLRRGAIHEAFGVTRDPGLTDVLRHGVPWDTAVRTTAYEHLHVLPRGRNVPQPSEYLLSRSTDQLLQELYSRYDYIIIDSSPILAADDTASLAPKIDATLFVVRLSFTSAKMTRKSLEILYNRQANIPGLILNHVDTSSPEFVYYQYSDYYQTATDNEPDDSSAKTRLAAK